MPWVSLILENKVSLETSLNNHVINKITADSTAAMRAEVDVVDAVVAALKVIKGLLPTTTKDSQTIHSLIIKLRLNNLFQWSSP